MKTTRRGLFKKVLGAIAVAVMPKPKYRIFRHAVCEDPKYWIPNPEWIALGKSGQYLTIGPEGPAWKKLFNTDQMTWKKGMGEVTRQVKS